MSTSLGNLNRILRFHAIIGKFYLYCFTVFCTIQTRDVLDIVLLHAYRMVVYQKPVLGENNNRILMVVLDYLFPDNTVYIVHCYIASVNTKRDWLICSHVALDKCNVSRPGNK